MSVPSFLPKYQETICMKYLGPVVAFAKATHIFSAKITELDTVLIRAVNILTTNELVKLTMLWTTGPCIFDKKKDKTSCELVLSTVC